MQACTASAPLTACNCALHVVEEEWTEQNVRREEATLLVTGKFSPEALQVFTSAVATCR